MQLSCIFLSARQHIRKQNAEYELAFLPEQYILMDLLRFQKSFKAKVMCPHPPHKRYFAMAVVM